MKRQKTVFSSNRELAHIWAQQSQYDGRANNMFFEGDSIFSYGRHYKIARIHSTKRGKICLLNSNGYSATTQMHRSYTFSAVHGLMPVADSSNPDCLKTAWNEAVQAIDARIDAALKKVKVTAYADIDYQLSEIKSRLEKTNELAELLGKRSVKISAKKLKAVKDHLTARLKRYQELNTPEAIEKKEAAKAKREASKQAKIEREKLERIEKFRRFESHSVPGLGRQILRVKEGVVETSGGARVDLKDALRLLDLIEKNQAFGGEKIGPYMTP